MSSCAARPFHQFQHFGDALRPICCPQRQGPVDGSEQGQGIPAAPDLNCRYQRIRSVAQHRLLAGTRVDQVAADRAIGDAADRENIRKRTLRGALDHLFDRRVMARVDLRVCRGRAWTDVARRAEIDQDRIAVGSDQNIGGLDVAMQETRSMHARQWRQNAATAETTGARAASAADRSSAGRPASRRPAVPSPSRRCCWTRRRSRPAQSQACRRRAREPRAAAPRSGIACGSRRRSRRRNQM